MLRRDGSWFWANGVMTALRQSDGTLRGYSKILRDDTERAEAEATRLHFRALFESAPGLYVVLRPDTYEIVAVSDAYLEVTKTSRDTIVGRTIFDAFPSASLELEAESAQNLRASLERVRATRRADFMGEQRFTVRTVERSGDDGDPFDARWWSMANLPVPGADGEIEYIIHRVEDVTPFLQQMREQDREAEGHRLLESRAQHMQAEAVLRSQEVERANDQLRKLNEILEVRVAERDRLLGAAQDAREEADLQRTEAERQRAEALAAGEAKIQFLTNISHELRTPLNSIAGHVQL